MRKFVEVLTDYQDENGNVYIDCYTTSDADEGGVSAGYVTPDGEFVMGKFATEQDVNQEIVQEAIKEVVEFQLQEKQKVVDKVIKEIALDFAKSDLTAVDELLKFVPTQNLIAYLPEE
jgi:hypothetical protein